MQIEGMNKEHSWAMRGLCESLNKSKLHNVGRFYLTYHQR